uniref:Uncharacterized protein n=1 Tax=Arundo donax TaxID=35708 RepID=A0A0A9DZ64_ARUDO
MGHLLIKLMQIKWIFHLLRGRQNILSAQLMGERRKTVKVVKIKANLLMMKESLKLLFKHGVGGVVLILLMH